MQAALVEIITSPAAQDREVHELLSFRRPRRHASSTSTKLAHLTEKQHDVMYALSGCIDVVSVLSRVHHEVCGLWGLPGVNGKQQVDQRLCHLFGAS